jgi:chromosome segregation ATPase
LINVFWGLLLCLIDLTPRPFDSLYDLGGKSAVLVGLVTCLGAAARFSNRGSKLGDLVKTGCHQATIRITLRNEGPEAYKPELYGKSITVERRIVKEGGGGYKIKDQNGKNQSSLREELDAILEQFNLQVENPCNVLMQDASKMFLAGNKPEKKYELFLNATQLEQMKQDLEDAGNNLKMSEATLEAKQGSLGDMEERLKVLEGKVQALQALEKYRTKVKHLRACLAWSHVHMKESELEIIESEMAKLEEQLTKLTEAKQTKEKLIEQMKQDQTALAAGLEQYKTEARNLATEAFHTNEEERRIRAEATKYDAEMEAHKAEQARIQKRKDNVRHNIRALQTTGRGDKDVQYRKNLANAEKKREMVGRMEAELKDFESRKPSIDVDVTADEERIHVIESLLQGLTRDSERAELEVKRLDSSRTDPTAVFGASAPAVVKLIKDNAKLFTHPPIGPIGMKCKLLEEEWSPAIEILIGKSLDKFVVHNVADMKQLQKLTANLNPQPSIVLSPFTAKQYKIAPHPEYKTLLSVLQIDDPIIFNALVDDGNPERTLLFQTSKEAKDVIFQNLGGPNIAEAFSLEQRLTVQLLFGTQVIKGNKMPVTKRLHVGGIGDVTAMLRDAKAKHQNIQVQLQPARQEHNTVRQRLATNQKSQRHISDRMRAIPIDLERLNGEIEELEKAPEVEPDKAEEINALEATLPDFDTKIQAEAEEIAKVHAAKIDFLKGLEPVLARKRDASQRGAEIEEKVGEVSREMDTLDKGIRASLARIPHFAMALEKLQKDSEGHTTRHAEQSKLVEVYCIKAQTLSKRPTEPIEESPDQITRKIDSLESMIEQQRNEGQLDTSVLEQYENAKRTINELHSAIAETKEAIDLATDMLDTRAQKWIKFRRGIAQRTRALFLSYLSVRNFLGDLNFDHKAKALHISINPNRAETGGTRDTTTLSGGERSYSTVSLLLALWENMESPFRAMDEFDVFMDAVNRRISMELLVETALEKKHRQHIFLTPQQLQGVHLGENVKIFRMKPAERNQRTITSMMGQEGEEDE